MILDRKLSGITKSALLFYAFLASLVLAIPATSFAHGVAGQRFFPTTFAVDDPFISDEFSALYHHNKLNSDDGGPRVEASSVDAAYSKRITPNIGIEADEQYQWNHAQGGDTARGFANLEVNLKYQFYTNPKHETILSVGVSDEIDHTGSHVVGAENFSTYSPAFFFGKGFGDLPGSMSYLRPFAVTGVIGPKLPSRKQDVTVDEQTGELDVERHPTTLTWAFTLQYSLMYLQAAVKDVGLGAPFNRMVAIVEFPMETCLNMDCKNQTTGTVNPGIAWIGKSMEFGLAAEIPMNPRSGANIGVFALFHLFLDDLFPNSIGRPIFP